MSEKKRTEAAAGRRLMEAVTGIDSVLCLIPGWDPVGLDAALEWIEQASGAGRQVDFRVVHEGRGAKVWLRDWDVDEPTPDWPEEWPDPDEE
ncbi:MAG: hypothetical protein R3190_04845 [Thermoanaerobaculia bacterium]|nr:hypothetical protein [Thermoanaerobaculia bacterium]